MLEEAFLFSLASYYLPKTFRTSWWAHLGSNQGPAGYEPVALPLSYGPLVLYNFKIQFFVPCVKDSALILPRKTAAF
jgi:hypothetical protein